MKNINNLKPQSAIIFNDNDEEIILTTGNQVLLTTDETEHDKTYQGEITFINEDCIIIDNRIMIYWEYVLEITNMV